MSDFDHDLYGDLDLEDLDATQLDEELVDPELEGHEGADVGAISATAGANADSSSGYAAPAPGGSALAGGQGQGGSSGGEYRDSNSGYDSKPDNRLQPGGGADYGDNRMKPSDMPDEGKMFIGGLNWETTDDGLRAYFQSYGDIDQCTIMRDPTGRSRGFAFLTFKDPASVQRVLEKDHQLDGKMIDPKRAIPRAEHERTAKVFVGGLAPSVTSESLKTFLGQFGKVMDATVMFDRLNGRSKGFAFATFADESGVDEAMNHSGIELEGRQIEIKKAQPRGAGTQVKSFNAPGGARSGGFNATSGMSGGFNMFDPSAMAMMYQNMLKASGGGMGGGSSGGGFDPNAMAMMYQNMMKGMGSPAINPNMARGMGMGGMGMGGMNMMGGMGMGMGMGGMGMGGMGMGGMGGMGMGGMGGMGGGMGGMGGNVGGGAGAGGGGMAGGRGRNVPNAPRGPAAMRNPGGPSGMAQPMAQGSSRSGSGSGPQRYSTQGSQRAKPY